MITELENGKIEFLKSVNVVWRRARSPWWMSGARLGKTGGDLRRHPGFSTPGYTAPSLEVQQHPCGHDSFDSQRQEMKLQGKRSVFRQDWEGGRGRSVCVPDRETGWAGRGAARRDCFSYPQPDGGSLDTWLPWPVAGGRNGRGPGLETVMT